MKFTNLFIFLSNFFGLENYLEILTWRVGFETIFGKVRNYFIIF